MLPNAEMDPKECGLNHSETDCGLCASISDVGLGSALCSPVPMFPEPMFPGTDVPRFVYCNSRLA